MAQFSTELKPSEAIRSQGSVVRKRRGFASHNGEWRPDHGELAYRSHLPKSGKMKCCGNKPPEQRGNESMAKRRGNPNWGKPEPIGPVVPTITSFEMVVKEYKLTPDQYIRSTRLREWARRNKNSKYIPEALLEAWGFEIESTL
jgi:hypothetical protein